MNWASKHKKIVYIVSAILLVDFIYLLISGGTDYIERIIIGIAINIILALGLNFFSGLTGLFSLGHVGFMALGAYVSSILTLPLQMKAANLPDLPEWLAHVQLPFFPAVLIAALFAMVVAFFIGIPLMRLIGPYVSVATMGFLVITQVVLTNWDTFTRGARTFAGVPAYTSWWNVWLWALFVVYIVLRLKFSSFGRSMRASRDNAIAAESIGIPIVRSRLLAFCVSAFITAIGGALWAHFIRAFSPKSFYFAQTFSVITMVIIGGLGSIRGSLAGVLFVTVISEILRNLERGINLGIMTIPPTYGSSQVLMALILILMIVFKPAGLFGETEWKSRDVILFFKGVFSVRSKTNNGGR